MGLSVCATTSAEKTNMQYSAQTHSPDNAPRANTENVNDAKRKKKNREKKKERKKEKKETSI